jgi:hypothetical protein
MQCAQEHGSVQALAPRPTLSIASSAACAKQLDNLVRKITADTERAIVRIVSSLAGRLLQEQRRTKVLVPLGSANNR